MLDRQLIDEHDVESLRYRHGVFSYQLAMCIADDPIEAWVLCNEWWRDSFGPAIRSGNGPNGKANMQTWMRALLTRYLRDRWRAMAGDEDLLDRRTMVSLHDLEEDEKVFDPD